MRVMDERAERVPKLIFFAGNTDSKWREKGVIGKVRTRLVSYANKKEIVENCIPVYRERERK